MKKLLILLAFAALPLISLSQTGVGDLINMTFALYGVERVQDVVKHTNPTGYYFLLVETQCVVDTIWWLPGKKPSGVSVTMHNDTLFARPGYLFQIKSIKLRTGRCLLYKNRP